MHACMHAKMCRAASSCRSFLDTLTNAVSCCAQSVTFTASIIDPNTTALTLANGTANEVAAQYKSEIGLTNLLLKLRPDRTLTRAALFIDVNKDSLAPIAHLKGWNFE